MGLFSSSRSKKIKQISKEIAISFLEQINEVRGKVSDQRKLDYEFSEPNFLLVLWGGVCFVSRTRGIKKENEIWEIADLSFKQAFGEKSGKLFFHLLKDKFKEGLTELEEQLIVEGGQAYEDYDKKKLNILGAYLEKKVRLTTEHFNEFFKYTERTYQSEKEAKELEEKPLNKKPSEKILKKKLLNSKAKKKEDPTMFGLFLECYLKNLLLYGILGLTVGLLLPEYFSEYFDPEYFSEYLNPEYFSEYLDSDTNRKIFHIAISVFLLIFIPYQTHKDLIKVSTRKNVKSAADADSASLSSSLPKLQIHPDDTGLITEDDNRWWNTLSLEDCKEFEEQDTVFKVAALKKFMEEDGLSEEEALRKVRKSFLAFYGYLSERKDEPLGFKGDDAQLPYVLRNRANRAIHEIISKMNPQKREEATSVNALVRNLIRTGII